MVGRCAHQIGPAVVRVDGDRATAIGYSRVPARRRRIAIYRVSMNRWELDRVGGGWLMRGGSRILGHDEARNLRGGLSEV
jgi:hypothetical protein